MNPKLGPFLLSGALLLGFVSPAESAPLALTPGIAIAQSPTTQVAVDNFESLKKLLFNPQGGMVAGAVVIMMVLSWRSDGTGSKAKNRLATSRWASGSQTVWLSWLILTTCCPIGVGVARFGFERAIGWYVNFGEAMHSETELARRSFTC